MIQAIVEGRKTQTRRVIKPQPRRIDDAFDGTWEWKEKGHYYDDLTLYEELRSKPPYQVGETVYIKEAWAEWINTSEHLASGVISIEEARADVIYKATTPNWDEILKENGNPYLIKHTLLMPEWAARYFIKIKAVRAERLQEITNEGIIAEGIARTQHKCNPGFADAILWYYHDGGTYCGDPGVPVFRRPWDSINKDYPWESNPWVWVYTFVKLEA